MFKILSLDGGGMKGTFAAAFLDELQSSLEHPVASYFDLIAGTSTGGILALALGMGFSAQEILSLYKEEGEKIFPSSKLPWWLQGRATKYKAAGLKSVLEEKFGSRLFGESKYRLIIPALEENTGRVHVYKNAYHSRLRTDYKKLAVDVAMSTAAAPVYLPAHESDAGISFLDGGLWANNPAAISASEAVGLLRIPCEDIRILSIGTTDSPVRQRPAGWRVLSRAKHMLDLSMAAQSSGSLGIAKTLLGGSSVVRINPSIAQGTAALDGTNNLRVLEGLGRSEGRRACTRHREPFFLAPAPVFTPIYSLNSTS
jgi:patatin-like phospholipase/acyl hydrolase